MTYVGRLAASSHDAGTVYAAFENHKNEDFKPYLLKSTDSGKTWTSIAGDLPDSGPVLAFVEDTVNPNLLFAGTELGAFFTIDGGQHWVRLKGGLPTIAVRDMVIQAREGDLVMATFGRGFYVLDDITPLRQMKAESTEHPAAIFPVKDALMYVERHPLGGPQKGFQGDAFYAAENPPYGAVFTAYLKEKVKTKKEKRQDAEKDAADQGPLVLAGSYSVRMFSKVGGAATELAGPQAFKVATEGGSGMSAADRAAQEQFMRKVARLYRAVSGALHTAEDVESRLKGIREALREAPAAEKQLGAVADSLEQR